MTLLLDTHVLVWLLEDADRIGEFVYEQIRLASRAGSVWVSAITPWEIGLLVSKKRLNLSVDVQEWMNLALGLPGVRLQELLPEIAVSSTRLPWDIHPDPADRILVATARHLGATLVTADEQLLGYGALGYLRCQAAGQN